MQHLQRHGTRLDFGTEEDMADLECALAARWARRDSGGTAPATGTADGGGRVRRHEGAVPMQALRHSDGASSYGPAGTALQYEDDESPEARFSAGPPPPPPPPAGARATPPPAAGGR